MPYPSTVKAIGIKETGGFEVIQDLELPFPEVKPTDLLVKVIRLDSTIPRVYAHAHRVLLGPIRRRQLHRHLFQVCNKGSKSMFTWYSRSNSYRCRSGLYKAPFLPLPISGEVSGVIVELPTDQELLVNESYKSRGFKKGGTVALVRFFLNLYCMLHTALTML